jgi:HK97 gp10 family phage protein
MAVSIQGLEPLTLKFETMASGESIKKGLGDACSVVEKAAKEKAPKDTGELRRSIESRIEGLTGVVFTPLEYAPYVEYGTGLFAVHGGRTDVPWSYQDDKGDWHSTNGQHPQPYMEPALNENREEILRILKEATVPNG